MANPVSLFAYRDYKAFTQDRLTVRGAPRAGLRKRLAERIGCRPSYLSQVLRGKNQLSKEQALRVCRFFELDARETRFYLALVELARAGSPDLRDLLEADLERLRHAGLNDVQAAIEGEFTLDDRQTAEFFGNWRHTAIFSVLQLRDVRTTEKLSTFLGIPRRRVEQALKFLLGIGLVQRVGEEYVQAYPVLHTGGGALVAPNYANWRLKAIDSIAYHVPTDFHASVLLTLDEDQFVALKSRMSELLKEMAVAERAATRKTSLVCFNLDFFELGERAQSR